MPPAQGGVQILFILLVSRHWPMGADPKMPASSGGVQSESVGTRGGPTCVLTGTRRRTVAQSHSRHAGQYGKQLWMQASPLCATFCTRANLRVCWCFGENVFGRSCVSLFRHCETIPLHVHSPANSSVNHMRSDTIFQHEPCAARTVLRRSVNVRCFFRFVPVSRAEFLLLVSRHMPMGENPREHARECSCP